MYLRVSVVNLFAFPLPQVLAMLFRFSLLLAAFAPLLLAGTVWAGAESHFSGVLDARQGRVEVPGHADFDGPPLTVECWAKLYGKQSCNILVARDTKASSRHWELFTVAGSGHFTVYIPGYAPDHVHTKIDIVDGQWHHLAMTHDGQRIKLYIDGQRKADTAVQRKRQDGPSGALAIGGLVEGTLHCNGKLDDVHIHKGIHTFTRKPAGPAELANDTVGLWPLDRREKQGYADASPAHRWAVPIAHEPLVQHFAGDHPKSLDERLSIELFAREPDIVTPIGMAVDRQGRLLVLESNTHFPPKGYNRHPSDRLLLVEDTDRDGKADSFKVFADGFTAAMHLTVHPDGAVYIVTRGALIRLRDKDGDGVADQRDTLLKLETTCTYPHNGLFSCALDWNNHLYVSMGENLGADYRLIGNDGSAVKGGGEGGNIFRATAEGGQVEKIATGFWNPVQLHFDIYGRLFTVDNDPDSRPPCRLIHIVPGGDYGYRFRNGRPGLHPFTAWNGELPGTLPMVAGTGEAPSSVLTCEDGILPDSYRGTILATSWGDHRIDDFRLRRRGVSFRAERSPLFIGPADFRPVTLTAAPDNSIYVTDWVDKSYEVHGKGRLWRIRPKDASSKPTAPRAPEQAITSTSRSEREQAARQLARTESGRQLLRQQAVNNADPHLRATAIGALSSVGAADDKLRAALAKDKSADVRELVVRLLNFSTGELLDLIRNDSSPGVQAAALERVMLTLQDKAGLALVLEQLKSDDPFLRTAAREALRKSPQVLAQIDVQKLSDPAQQRELLLTLRAAGNEKAETLLPRFLHNPDALVQFVAVQWIGEERLQQHRAALLDNLQRPNLSSELFAATLTALALVDGASFAEAARGGQIYLEKLLADAKSPAELKVQALRRLRPDSPLLTLATLKQWLRSEEPRLQLEAIRTLRASPLADKFSLLAELAQDTKFPVNLRAEATAALGDDSSGSGQTLLLQLAQAQALAIQQEALRSLRGLTLTQNEQAALQKVAQQQKSLRPLVQKLLHAKQPPKTPALLDVDTWLSLLEGPANAAAGERIFFHAKSAHCARCHRFNGRGSEIGPDLSLTARSLDRRRLVESILQPSKEIAPLFTVWTVETTAGRVFQGMLLQENEEGEQIYADANGQLIRLPHRDIENRQPQRQSLMPDDIAHSLTVQEFRDLLAFLQGTEPKTTPTPN